MEAGSETKAIELVNVRPAVEADDMGRITKIITKVRIHSLAFEVATWRTWQPSK